jgi:hypothetical protein
VKHSGRKLDLYTSLFYKIFSIYVCVHLKTAYLLYSTDVNVHMAFPTLLCAAGG